MFLESIVVSFAVEVIKIVILYFWPNIGPWQSVVLYFIMSLAIVLFNYLRQPNINWPLWVKLSLGCSGFVFLVLLFVVLNPPVSTCVIQVGSEIRDVIEDTNNGSIIERNSIRTVEAIESDSIVWKETRSSKGINENVQIAYGTVPFLSREVFDTLLSTKDVSVQLIDQDVDEGRFVVLYLREVRTVPMKVNGDTVRLEVVEAITDKGDRIEILNNREYPLILLFDVRERRKVLRRTYELDNFACSYVFEPIGVLTGILN